MLNSPRRLFLIDGFGALITAALLYFLLAKHEPAFGMPKQILNILSFVAIFYSMYSFTCYFIIKQNPKRFLFIIAAANALYCTATISLMLYYYSQLTGLGLIYFIGEIIIIMTLALIEFSVARSKPSGTAVGISR